jgi:hypothetical protein
VAERIAGASRHEFVGKHPSETLHHLPVPDLGHGVFGGVTRYEIHVGSHPSVRLDRQRPPEMVAFLYERKIRVQIVRRYQIISDTGIKKKINSPLRRLLGSVQHFDQFSQGVK